MISILASLTQWRKPQESNTQISIFSSVAIPWAVPWPPWPLLGSGTLGPWASGPWTAKTNTAANKNDTAAITTNDSSSKHYDSSNYQTMDGILGPLVPGPYPPLGLPCALPGPPPWSLPGPSLGLPWASLVGTSLSARRQSGCM